MPAPNVDGYILAKTTANGSRHNYALKITTVDMEDFYSATIEFRYSAADNPVRWFDIIINSKAKFVSKIYQKSVKYVLNSLENRYIF